ncbi:4-alpha-glucanotransferase [Paracoccus benzoatiresistens]|uniref:4-alpha-glucanotransferase n=1 Tax=Paracoccus benzoatiresistens TaxID=2997341 RepID=A0ABT4J1G3_9RHOB|nr:4-alpha-glucanotransferase [Paracoccus sp. EF6]MCZ0960932.1 4-alpha-glucanotransferase [Paracoccus sp. EF6]
MNDIKVRAQELGLQADYEGVGGTRHQVPAETLEKLVAAFGDAPAMRPQVLEAPEGVRCHLPDRPRGWGVAVQLYQVRSARNWGIGDFADLETLATILAAEGADFIGLNPLHAMFLSDPARCSPFSPSNRRFLNPLYIAVDRVPGFTPDMADPNEIARLQATDLVDYPAVAAAKLHALRMVWQAVGAPDAGEAFRSRGGEDLDRHALFEAVSARMVVEGHGAGWRDWPTAWQEAGSPEVSAFARDHAPDLAFHRWLQDQADQQLARAQDTCRAAGMAIGLYLDIAVGEAADGSGSWGRPDVLGSVRIGAPADYFNEKGQDWGLAPLSPATMAATQAAPFGALMDRVMRRAGAVRIDHAMGLWQLFLIPDGADATAGTYARYPLDDMLRALARASNENGSVVIGEDLGNVPPGFREMMEAAGVLSYRILFFERHETGFIAPQDYPANALACLSTHDLPTFQGWWRGDDVRLRQRFDLVSEETGREQADARPAERQALVQALADAGLLPEGQATDGDAAPLDVVVAAHRYLARTPCRLMAVRLEDLAGEIRPVNVPSTWDEYPNWRPKLGQALDDIVRSDTFRAVTEGIRAERPPAGD